MKQSPKEKAVELFNKMFLAQDETLRWLPDAKQCALIAVDEILETIGSDIFSEYKYWQEVKQEIQNL